VTTPPAAPPLYDIVAANVNKSFNDHRVLCDASLQVRSGETFFLLGPSGSGKSIFLKHLAGLIRPDSGTITVLGRDILALEDEALLEHRRQVGLVFQSGALFNSLSLEDNVALALREHRLHPPERIREIVQEKLALVGLEGSARLLPEEISGGMKKRAAVARTLALEPRIILFDEPTAGLDPIMARNVDDLIMDLKTRVRVTSVVVSHDLPSAFTVADRVGMIHEGRIIGCAPPAEFQKLDDTIIQRFIGRDLSWRR